MFVPTIHSGAWIRVCCKFARQNSDFHSDKQEFTQNFCVKIWWVEALARPLAHMTTCQSAKRCLVMVLIKETRQPVCTSLVSITISSRRTTSTVVSPPTERQKVELGRYAFIIHIGIFTKGQGIFIPRREIFTWMPSNHFQDSKYLISA